jgi:arabinofuranan 3-O-arabinosyltransferase
MTTTLGPPPTAGSPSPDDRPAPRSTPAGPPDRGGNGGVTEAVQRRLRLLAASVALTVLAFVQAPGRIAPDTKLDLSVDPLGFLLRAWNLWEPLGASGQLQNQAYGYFIPMGPIYLVGDLLGFPAWIIQRAWWALVLVVGFHGMYRLLGRMGVGVHSTQLIAALAYTLSPRMITELGPVSIEAWPIAMAPWVLLPLVKVTPGGEATAAARSGLAIALCGGVNAVAVGAVLPLPVWWLLTREKSAMKRKLAAWWSLAVVFGTLWWLGPLVVLGRYSPPFLDWVESASVSTSKGSLPGAFRGTTQWVAWFQLPEPIWLAGWSVLSSPAGILLGWLLIGLSVLGMVRRDTPNRAFLIGGAIGGLLLMTLGHVGQLTPPWAPAIQNFLDAAGAPLRNTHKFDVVLRIPMIIGLAHAITKLKVPEIRGLPFESQTILRFIAACALLGTAAPALVGQLPSRGSFTEVPGYWREAAAYLENTDDGARTLIVPGSTFATSVWGDPHDEPFQPLARTKWAVRDGVPLSSAGNIRMLTIVEQQLASGRGSPGLAEFLARAGISRLLVRADLARSFQPGSAPLPVTVRSALEQSPGLKPVARFGPMLSGRRTPTEVADDGIDIPTPALEVWEVERPTRLAEVFRAPSVMRVSGGTESLLSLADAGVLGRRPTVLDADPEAGPFASAPLVLTDTPQRREANVAQVRDLYSAVMTPDQGYVRDRRVYDWLPYERPLVTSKYEGVQAVSSLSKAGESVGPWYAVDGDPSTAWVSSPWAVGQWLEIRFPEPVNLPSTLELTPSPAGARLAAVDVATDTGSERSDITLGANLQALPQAVRVPQGPTRTLRITVAKTWNGTELNPVSISEIRLPGITPRRPLVVPAAPNGGTTAPGVISLRATRDGSDSCATVNDRAWCSPRQRRQSEDIDLDRIIGMTGNGTYDVVGTVRARETEQVDPLLEPDVPFVKVAASSRWTQDPAQRPQAAMDRSLATGWVATTSDTAPTLKLTWKGARTVDRLQWRVDKDLMASKPAQLIIRGSSGAKRVATPDKDGWVSFQALRGDSLDVTVQGVDPLYSLDRITRFPTPMPVGVSELDVPALKNLQVAVPDWRPVTLPCGQGPTLTVGQSQIPTRVSGTIGALLRREPLEVTPCAAVPPLAAGTTRVRLDATPQLKPESVTMTLRQDAPADTDPGLVTVPEFIDEVSPEHRVIGVTPSDTEQLLVVHENSNPGWRATLQGRELTKVRIDGWQQGYVIPAKQGGDVVLEFTPGKPYRIILVTGLAMVALLAAWAIPRRKRKTGSTGKRGARLAEPLPLRENTSMRGLGMVTTAALFAFGGFWGLGALAAVLIGVRRRVQMRWMIAGACVAAGVGAAQSTNADTRGVWAAICILASLVLAACLVIRLDADGDRLLTKASLRVDKATRVPRRRPKQPRQAAPESSLLGDPPPPGP